MMGNPATPALHPTHELSESHGANNDYGWGSSSTFGWGLASIPGWGPAPHCDQITRASGQKKFSKQSDPPTHTLHSTEMSVRTGELVTEGATVFWKPPPLQDHPHRQGKAKGRQAKQVWSHFVEMETAPGLPVESGQTVMVRMNKSLLSEEDAKFTSETARSQMPEAEHRTSLPRTMVWDRARGRCLTFFRLWTPDERIHYDEFEYGFPLPNIKYWTKEGSQGYLPVGKPSTWAYFGPGPQPKSRELVGTQPSLEDCRPKPVPFPAPPPLAVSTPVNLISTGAETLPTSVPPEVSMLNDPSLQHPCKTGPPVSTANDETLDWGTDDEESHSAASDPKYSLVHEDFTMSCEPAVAIGKCQFML